MKHFTVLIGLLFSASLLADPQLAQCDGCHGAKGVSQTPTVPTIAGMSANYMLDSFIAYQKGERQHPVMQSLVKGATKEQLNHWADFYAKQNYVKATQAFDPALAKQGKQVHNQQCAICHDTAGTIAEDDAGFLSGQWQPYLKLVMEEYRSGKRQGSKKMIEKMQTLSDSQLEQLLHYYASGKE